MRAGLAILVALALAVLAGPAFAAGALGRLAAVTGDEPHYLVMADGIARHGTLEQTVPYRQEFRTRDIYKPGLAPRDAEPSPQNTHAVRGPHGLYNIHDIGLPLLLAAPYRIGRTLGPVQGILAARLFMVLIAAAGVFCQWKFSGLYGNDWRLRALAVFATSAALPLVPGALEIYPDIPAGVIALLGLYWFATSAKPRGLPAEAVMAGAVAFLPWLQIKFSIACAILLLAMIWTIHRDTKDRRRIGMILMVGAVSAAALAAYNQYAFGHVLGPYQSDALELNKTSLMVGLGLFFDQNQGFLLQNPLHLVGVFALGRLCRRQFPFFVVWALVFLSLLALNALHPNWYGGGSFSGRFGWAAVLVFSAATLYGLAELAKESRRLFYVVIALAILIQALFILEVAANPINIFNHPAGTWPYGYPIFFPFQAGLPMLYDSSWAYRYAPNYAWLLAILALLGAGFLPSGPGRLRAGVAAAAVGACLIVVCGLLPPPFGREVTLSAASLPSEVGRIDGTARVAEPGVDHAGLLNFGPDMPIRPGAYEVAVQYSSQGGPGQTAAVFDIYDQSRRRTILSASLPGTGQAVREARYQVRLGGLAAHAMEFRNRWDGVAKLKVYSIRVRKL